MTSSIPSQPAQQLTSFVCPKNKTREECYEAGLAEEKLAFKDPDHIDNAIGYLKKAAERGENKAYVDLARVILQHKPAFINEALAALEKVPPHKYPEADHLMANIYLGDSHKDINKAIDCLRNCNDTMAPRRLASIYLAEGRKDEALAILQQKANEGDSWCCLKLGLLCVSGEVHEGQNRAESLLEKGKTQTLLDNKLTWNSSKTSDYSKRSNLRFLNEPLWKEAIAALNKIKEAKKESTSNENKELNNAKTLFEESEKSEFDIMDLYNSYQSLLEDDFDSALQNDTSEVKTNYRDAGRLAYRVKDEKAAFSYWKTGAAAGSKDCLYYLGCCFYSGRGCITDKARAKELWSQAAEGPDGNTFAKQEVIRMEGLNAKPLPTTPKDIVSAKGELKLKDVETEDRIRADKPWFNRAVYWIRNNPKEVGKITAITTLAIIAFAVMVVVALAIALFVILFPIHSYKIVHNAASLLPLGRQVLEYFLPFARYGLGVDTSPFPR